MKSVHKICSWVRGMRDNGKTNLQGGRAACSAKVNQVSTGKSLAMLCAKGYEIVRNATGSKDSRERQGNKWMKGKKADN